jgi:hypothetical protein
VSWFAAAEIYGWPRPNSDDDEDGGTSGGVSVSPSLFPFFVITNQNAGSESERNPKPAAKPTGKSRERGGEPREAKTTLTHLQKGLLKRRNGEKGKKNINIA